VTYFPFAKWCASAVGGVILVKVIFTSKFILNGSKSVLFGLHLAQFEGFRIYMHRSKLILLRD